jgi:Flp pilus assembly pilin Flp
VARIRWKPVTNLVPLIAAAWLKIVALIFRPPRARPRRHERDAPAGFASSESGATAVEYGLLLVLVSLASFTVLEAVSGGLNGVFQSVSDRFNAVR